MFNRRVSFFSLSSCTGILIALILSTSASAEEKSMWQKFKDFFSPVPTVVGEGPEYDELRDLDQQINKLEGRYSRERRANNKRNLRKQIDELKAKRESLAEKIEAKEKAEKEKQKTAISSATVALPSSSTTLCHSDTITIRDTLFVHDTITIHDTLYVIVADKANVSKASSTENEAASNATDSAATASSDSAKQILTDEKNQGSK